MLKRNKEVLRKKGMLEVINNCKGKTDLRIEGDNLIYKNVILDKDIEVKKEKIKPIDTIFLHGFGSGKMLKKLKKLYPEVFIVVFESNPCVIKKTLEIEDLSEVLNDDKVMVVLLVGDTAEKNIKTIISVLRFRFNWGDAKEFVVPGYDKVDFYDLKKVKEILDKEISSILINRNTLILRSRDINTNAMKSLPYIAKNGDHIEYLNDIFKDKPAVIVASGPSLNKNVKYLKEIKNKALIIAADSVLSVLEKEGIDPDFVCGVDYQRVNEIKYIPILRKRKVSDYRYVCVDGVYFSIPKLFKFSFFEVSNFLRSGYGDILGKLRKKHFFINNVTNLALQLTYILGANPVIFIGQDWAYSNVQDHAEGVVLDGKLPDKVMWVKGNYEDKVPTTEVLYSGLKLVEEMIRQTEIEGIKYVNATEGGAFIEGTEVITFKEAISKYMRDEVDKRILDEMYISPRFDDFINRTEKLSKSLEETIKKATKALSLANKVLKKWIRNKNVNEIRKDVEIVNKINDEITFYPIFASVVTNFYFKEFFNFYREEMYIEGQDTKERIEQSIKYFKLIKEKSISIKKKIDEMGEFLKLEREYFDNTKKLLKSFNKVLRLCRLYYDFKDIYSGLDLVDKALEVYPDNANLYYWRAKYCTLNRFMHKDALENFEKALALDPNFEKAKFDYEVEKKIVLSHKILIKKALEEKNFDQAKRLIRNAMDYDPDNEELKSWSKIINDMSRIDKNAKKQNVLFEKLKIEDESFDKYKTAIEFVKKEQFDKAFDLLKELYDKHGAFGDIPFLLGSIHVDRKELDKAEKYLKEAVELIPYQPLVYLALGKLYIEKEDYVLAKENLEKAISMSPDLKPGVLDTLGNIYYEFGEYEKAFRTFEEYLQYSDDKIKTLTKLAICYKEMGMIEEYNKLMGKIKSITEAN